MKVKISLKLKQFLAEKDRVVLEVKVLIPKELEQLGASVAKNLYFVT